MNTNNSTQNPAHTSLIDKNVLAQFYDLQIEGQPDILVEVINSFLETSPQRLIAIEKFVGLNDGQSVSKEAHALKSSSRTLGANALGEFCQQLEDTAKSEAPKKLSELFEVLKKAHQEAYRELMEIRAAQ